MVVDTLKGIMYKFAWGFRFSNRIDFDKTAAANVAEEKVDLRREATQR